MDDIGKNFILDINADLLIIISILDKLLEDLKSATLLKNPNFEPTRNSKTVSVNSSSSNNEFNGSDNDNEVSYLSKVHGRLVILLKLLESSIVLDKFLIYK